jgi:long-chain acyl-CoA synthetase
MTNLSVYLAQSADVYPDAAALRCGDETTSYSVLASDVARFADYLIDGGVRPGDRVGIMLPNRPAFAVVFYGVLHAGGVAVPMNPSQNARAVEFFSTITDLRALFFAPRHAVATTAGAVAAGTQPVEVGRHGIARLTAGYPGRTRPVNRAANDAAVILQTTPTADAPSATELTHADLISRQTVTARSLLHLGPDDVVMVCLPLFEGFGMTCGLAAVVSTGATLVLMPRFDARKALETIAAQRVTVFEGTPAMHAEMLAASDRYSVDSSSLRVCMSAGAPLEAGVLRQFEDRFACGVLEGYGLAGTTTVFG